MTFGYPTNFRFGSRIGFPQADDFVPVIDTVSGGDATAVLADIIDGGDSTAAYADIVDGGSA